MPTLLLFVIAVSIWGTTWIAITFQLPAVAAELGVALRFSLAAAVILLWCQLRGIPLAVSRSQHARLLAVGALGFCLSYFLVYHANRYIVSGLIAVGYSAAPLANMLLARVFLGTPLSGRVGVGGVLGLAGIVLIFWPEFARLAGDAPLLVGASLTAGAVLASCLSNILMTHLQGAGVKGWAPLGWGMLYGALLSWLAVLIIGRPLSIGWSVPFVISWLYLALAGSVLAFAAFYALVGRIGPARASYVGVMSTIVALIVSGLFEGYDWRWATVAGIGLAVAGNVFALQMPARTRPVESTA